jgi:hypothetical protein
MSYQHCPGCRLPVQSGESEADGGVCPRCATTLTDDPGPLLAADPTVPHRFSRRSSALRPETVRSVMAIRGGRLGRERPSLTAP